MENPLFYKLNLLDVIVTAREQYSVAFKVLW